jgi:GTPase SAR1 family protein
MFNDNKNKNEIIKILFLGLDGSGKSTIITKLRDFKVSRT